VAYSKYRFPGEELGTLHQRMIFVERIVAQSGIDTQDAVRGRIDDDYEVHRCFRV
jgi:hypothetical protein